MLLFIHCLLFLLWFVGVLRLVLVLLYALLSVLSSFATILTRKGDLVALLNCVPYVLRLHCVIMILPNHTHFLF